MAEEGMLFDVRDRAGVDRRARSRSRVPGLLVCACAGIVISCGAPADDPPRTETSGRARDSSVEAVAPSDTRVVAYRAPVMGTIGTVSIATADSAGSFPDALAAKTGWDRVDSLMSNWTDTSEIARINREAFGSQVTVEPEVARVLGRALSIGAESGGAFDVTVEPLVRLWGFLGGDPAVPSAAAIDEARERTGVDQIRFDPGTRTLRFSIDGLKIDFGGIAKGYGVDVAIEELRESGVSSAMVDISGNIKAIGSPPGREQWVVGVRDPRDRLPYLARLELRGKAVATSGNYEQFVTRDGKQYGHILDPRTGWPAEGLLSATVLAETAMDSDAWATAMVVLGVDEALRVAKARDDLDVILVVPPATEGGRDRVLVEDSLLEAIEPVEAAGEFTEMTTF